MRAFIHSFSAHLPFNGTRAHFWDGITRCSRFLQPSNTTFEGSTVTQKMQPPPIKIPQKTDIYVQLWVAGRSPVTAGTTRPTASRFAAVSSRFHNGFSFPYSPFLPVSISSHLPNRVAQAGLAAIGQPISVPYPLSSSSCHPFSCHFSLRFLFSLCRESARKITMVNAAA